MQRVSPGDRLIITIISKKIINTDVHFMSYLILLLVFPCNYGELESVPHGIHEDACFLTRPDIRTPPSYRVMLPAPRPESRKTSKSDPARLGKHVFSGYYLGLAVLVRCDTPLNLDAPGLVNGNLVLGDIEAFENDERKHSTFVSGDLPCLLFQFNRAICLATVIDRSIPRARFRHQARVQFIAEDHGKRYVLQDLLTPCA